MNIDTSNAHCGPGILSSRGPVRSRGGQDTKTQSAAAVGCGGESGVAGKGGARREARKLSRARAAAARSSVSRNARPSSLRSAVAEEGGSPPKCGSSGVRDRSSSRRRNDAASPLVASAPSSSAFLSERPPPSVAAAAAAAVSSFGVRSVGISLSCERSCRSTAVVCAPVVSKQQQPSHLQRLLFFIHAALDSDAITRRT